jgi:hypothetical protein
MLFWNAAKMFDNDISVLHDVKALSVKHVQYCLPAVGGALILALCQCLDLINVGK